MNKICEKIVAVVMTICLAVALTACAASPAGEPENPAATEPVETDNPTPSADEPASPEQENPYAETIQTYADALRDGWTPEQFMEAGLSYLCGIAETRQGMGYEITDVNGDGVDELLIANATVIYDLYTLVDDTPTLVLSGAERNAYMLCSGDILRNDGSNSAAFSFTAFYSLDGAGLRAEKVVICDAEADSENPWFVSEKEIDSASGTHISESEAQAILDSYPVVTPELTRFEIA